VLCNPAVRTVRQPRQETVYYFNIHIYRLRTVPILRDYNYPAPEDRLKSQHYTISFRLLNFVSRSLMTQGKEMERQILRKLPWKNQFVIVTVCLPIALHANSDLVICKRMKFNVLKPGLVSATYSEYSPQHHRIFLVYVCVCVRALYYYIFPFKECKYAANLLSN
jgi:hypothetical protein